MAKSIKFSREEMDLIKLFDAITGAATLDCVIIPDGENERIVFMVNRVDLSKAVGKNGVNVKKLKEKLSKPIDIIAYSDELPKFIRYLLYPAKIIKIEEQNRNDGKRVILVHVKPEDKGLAIGKNGRNIQKTNIFVKRHFKVDNVVIGS